VSNSRTKCTFIFSSTQHSQSVTRTFLPVVASSRSSCAFQILYRYVSNFRTKCVLSRNSVPAVASSRSSCAWFAESWVEWATRSSMSLICVCVAVCCSLLQCVAVCCSVLQCVAVCCSVLQYVAVCCSVLRFEWSRPCR